MVKEWALFGGEEKCNGGSWWSPIRNPCRNEVSSWSLETSTLHCLVVNSSTFLACARSLHIVRESAIQFRLPCYYAHHGGGSVLYVVGLARAPKRKSLPRLFCCSASPCFYSTVDDAIFHAIRRFTGFLFYRDETPRTVPLRDMQ